jgi:hypothetical protein
MQKVKLAVYFKNNRLLKVKKAVKKMIKAIILSDIDHQLHNKLTAFSIDT